MKFFVNFKDQKKFISCASDRLYEEAKARFCIPESRDFQLVWYLKEVDDFVDYEPSVYEMLDPGINPIKVLLSGMGQTYSPRKQSREESKKPVSPEKPATTRRYDTPYGLRLM